MVVDTRIVTVCEGTCMCRPSRGIVSGARIVVLVTVLSLLIVSAPAVAQTPPPATYQPLDIAAILLQPADLDAEGMPGFGVDIGQTWTTIGSAVAAGPYAFSRGGIDLGGVPGAGGILEDAGWLRLHELLLATPDPADPNSYAVVVVSGVEEFATADGAAAAFAAFGQEQALSAMTGGTVTALPDVAPMGDQSGVWRVETTTSDTGTPVSALTRWVRLDTLIVSVVIADLGGQSPPDPTALDRLTSRLLGRVEAARGVVVPPCLPSHDAGASLDQGLARVGPAADLHMPGLSLCALRLEGDGVVPLLDRYTTRDGIAIPLFGETPEDVAAAQAEGEQDGLVDSFIARFLLEDSPQAVADGPVQVASRLDVFTDEAAATAWFDASEARLRAESADVTLVSFEPGTPALGEASATYVGTLNDTGAFITTSTARFDNLVVAVRVVNTTGAVPEITQSMLLAQVTCMQQGGCLLPVEPPAILVASLPARSRLA
jgi:hypothetical protein